MRPTFVTKLMTITSAAVLTAGLAGMPATAKDPGTGEASSSEDPQRIDNQDPALLAQMRRQEKLSPAANALLEAAMKLPTDSGFAGVAYESDGVTLYYKGTLPTSMTTAVTQARKTAPVAIKQAAHSQAELERAQAMVTEAVVREHSDIQAIGIAADGSGMVVERMSPAVAAAMRVNLMRKKGVTSKNADALLADLKLDVPVTVRTAKGPDVLQASREDDYSPWNGGAQFETWRIVGGDWQSRSSWCTTGFGVRKGSQTYVLTAAHCMTAPDRAYNGHKIPWYGCCFEEIGPVYLEDWGRDVLLINARGSALMFDGGVNSSYTKKVYSWAYKSTNELLCASGSKSGVICGYRTDQYEYNRYGCDSDGDCYTMYDLARADNINGQCTTHGDSGGPVFSLDGDGVRAKGIIWGVGEPCTHLYFQDMDQIVGGNIVATPITW